MSARAPRDRSGRATAWIAPPDGPALVPGLIAQLRAARSAGPGVIVVDLRALPPLENEALMELCRALRRSAGPTLQVLGADARVSGVLELCAIDGLEVCASLQPLHARPSARTSGITSVWRWVAARVPRPNLAASGRARTRSRG